MCKSAIVFQWTGCSSFRRTSTNTDKNENSHFLRKNAISVQYNTITLHKNGYKISNRPPQNPRTNIFGFIETVYILRNSSVM